MQASTPPEIRWVNVEGLGDVKLLQSLGQRFGLHPLALEDAVNVHQRPKFEDYQGHLFFIVRMPLPSPANTTANTTPGATPNSSPSNSLEEMQRFHSEQVSNQLIDMVETYRELTSGLVDIHLSSVSNRMNEVMKVLTIIATIFIPLTFISGIYGMNFDPAASPWNMPELRSPYGYVSVIAAMTVIAAGLLGWFRYKGWLG